ncbi:MAG: rhomboid family intramembrane serine protease [Planctomycetes bacterium]|nr:rhomboid family intramembrane serine protease [Planctomycetota bacterium]MBI3846480.1 rhomboid family intramembrane serine protease [Planctomycetota bacterium]
MFPIKDDVPSRRFPVVTVSLIAANVAVFLWQLGMSPLAETAFVHRFGVVPAAVMQLLGRGADTLPVQFEFGPRAFSIDLPVDFYHVARSFFACLFIHGGIAHLIGNMWVFWIFGDNVEDRMGHVRFLAFYLLSGLGASVVHVATNANSTIPTIGASGAIAGVLGAYLVSYPRARIMTLVPIFFFASFVEIPSFVFLGLWFLIQLLSSAGSDVGAGGVAWWAHVGGFLLGIVLLPVFRRRVPSES